MSRGARTILPLLFVVLVMPTILVEVFLTPPIQVADEDSHFLRAAQVARGGLFARKFGDNDAGGDVDPSAPIFAHAFEALKFRRDVKIDASKYAAASALTWTHGRVAPATFANTAVYPFFLYMPASTGLALGRRFALSVMDSFFLARFVTALASVAMCALALRICRQGNAGLFVLLSFPMTTSLLASVSQDAMSVSLAALGAALWSSYVARGVAMPVWARTVVALLIGSVAAARLPLFPLAVLAAMPTRRPERIGWPKAADAAAASATLIPIAIGLFGAQAVKVPFRTEAGVDATAQLHWLVQHPVAAASVAIATIQHDAFRHMHDMIGLLGWLDTSLPKPFYAVMSACFLLALLLDASVRPSNALSAWSLLPLAAIILAVGGVFGALYLIWTPVGAPLVDGVQGRYFLSAAIVLVVSIPGLGWRLSTRTLDGVEWARLGLCCVVALMEMWVVPITLIHRYYG